MAFKLAIAAVLVASVQFSMNDAGTLKNYKFKLHFIKNDRGQVDQANIKQTLIDITRGWDGQTLVVDDETGEPAPYCPEACAVLYATPGFTDVALAVYLKEVSARVKT
jgi:hypothetical protein